MTKRDMEVQEPAAARERDGHGTPGVCGGMREPFTKLHIHLVWATWNRLPLITPVIRPRLYQCLAATCRELNAEAIAIGGIEDHVHLLARIPTTVSVGVLVKRMKGASSHLASHDLTPDSFFKWQGGYGAFTVSTWDVSRVRRYIQRQVEHHTNGTLSATLETIHRPHPQSAQADFA